MIWMDKNLDNRGRWRNVSIGFRMSPEESEDLNARVKLSGLTKQDYIVNRLLERDVIVKPSSRLFKSFREQIAELLTELARIENGEKIDEELLAIIETLAKTYNGLQEK